MTPIFRVMTRSLKGHGDCRYVCLFKFQGVGFKGNLSLLELYSVFVGTEKRMDGMGLFILVDIPFFPADEASPGDEKATG